MDAGSVLDLDPPLGPSRIAFIRTSLVGSHYNAQNEKHASPLLAFVLVGRENATEICEPPAHESAFEEKLVSTFKERGDYNSRREGDRSNLRLK